MKTFDPIIAGRLRRIESLLETMIAWFGPFLVFSIGGTILTVVVYWYRGLLARCYRGMKNQWHQIRGRVPSWMLPILRGGIGLLGAGLVLGGLLLVPLPGPGNLLVLGGAALLDLEFGWAIPLLEWVLKWWPDRWTPKRLKRGNLQLKSEPE